MVAFDRVSDWDLIIYYWAVPDGRAVRVTWNVQSLDANAQLHNRYHYRLASTFEVRWISLDLIQYISNCRKQGSKEVLQDRLVSSSSNWQLVIHSSFFLWRGGELVKDTVYKCKLLSVNYSCSTRHEMVFHSMFLFFLFL